MKTIILFAILTLPSLGGVGGGLYAQIVNIPDPAFKIRLIEEGVDTNMDGEIQVSEAEAVTGMLDVSALFPEYLIYDLTGIEAFVNITGLNVDGNQLTTLDLSNNLLLTELDCIDNNLTYLNVENCVNLEILRAYHNQLTSIDLSQNVSLKEVFLSNNQLTSIDLTSNNLLEKVYVTHNLLSVLDLTQNSELVHLACYNNSLVHLDVRNGNNTHFIYFDSTNNPNLTCIFVDDAEYSESTPGWHKDPASAYVETQAECDALNIEDIFLQSIHIYPSPVKNILYLQTPDKYSDIEISVVDVKGNSIINYLLQDTQAQIDMSHLQSGMYFVIFKNLQTKETLTKKLIKL